MHHNAEWRLRVAGQRRLATLRRERAERVARVAPVVEPLAALGVTVRLIHPGDPLWSAGWIGDRAAMGCSHIDWANTPAAFDRAVSDGTERAATIADALDRYADDDLLAMGSNAADPMLRLSRVDAQRHMATLERLDPFELFLLTPAASWLVEARSDRVRATDGIRRSPARG